MAVPKNVVSLDTDDMVAGGLPDDFRGVVTEARFVPWDYQGKIDFKVIAARVRIEPADDSSVDPELLVDGLVEAMYSTGANMDDFVPTDDGENEAEAGLYIMPVGTRTALGKSSNFAFMEVCAKDAGFKPAAGFVDVSVLEGLDAQWNRRPQPKRGGVQVTSDDDGRKRANDILVPTEVFGTAKAKAKTTKKRTTKTSKAGAKAKSKPADDDLDRDELEAEVLALVSEMIDEADGSLPKSKIVAAIISPKGPFGGKENAGRRKVANAEFATNADWLGDEDRPWTFADGVLTIE